VKALLAGSGWIFEFSFEQDGQKTAAGPVLERFGAI
jgi:hypothetical protein